MNIGGQILAHLVGDYLLQSKWMAAGKLRHWPQALVHGACYAIPFVFLTRSWWQLLLIGGSHAVFDRLRLSWYVVWIRDFLAPRKAWPKKSVLWDLAPENWLRVMIDNICHLLINMLILSL